MPESSRTPEKVKIYYREPVRAKFLEVYDERGARVEEGNARIEPRDPGLDVEHEAVLAVDLEDLPEGLYAVEYGVIDPSDEHCVENAYAFSVKDPSRAQPATPGEPVLCKQEGYVPY